jgi:hypothetical protein
VCIYIICLTDWITEDLNKGRLDLFYLLLAALMFVNTIIFVVVAMRYNYKEVRGEDSLLNKLRHLLNN